MRYLIVAMLLARVLTAEIPEEESLALRRIADFWEEGEYQIAKNQMETFLEEFPDSPYKNTLSSALGDLFLREKSYQTALNYYAQIQDPELSEKIFLHRMQCLYHLEWHATLADECEAYLKKLKTDPAHCLQATYLLAIALYSQALTAHKDVQTLTALAERAKPYFERLAGSELSEEVAGAFAHLQCILKDFKSASKIYLDLAGKSEKPEHHLFQAALIQSKYDQDLALKTFDQLARLGDSKDGSSLEGGQKGELAEEAAYNMLVLYFEQERYEEIVASKEKFIKSVPTEKRGLCALFIGRSYLHLKKYSEAAAELNAFLDSDVPQDRVRSALLFLVEAAYHSHNLDLLEGAITRLDKNDPEMPKVLFCRAIILKNQEQIAEAKKQIKSLLSEFPTFPDRAQASLELASLNSILKEWRACRESAVSFLKEFSKHELAQHAWRILLTASSELGKNQFISDLEQMLNVEKFLTASERSEWIFQLAKAHFEIGEHEKTIEVLDSILEENSNAQLLFAFSLRDGRKDEENFCIWAEKAIASNASLLPLGQQHVALFNSYVKQNKFEPAADHLYAALLEGANLHPLNVLWLADYFYSRFEKDPSSAYPAFEVLSRLPWSSLEDAEPFLLKMAKLHRHFGADAEAQDVLEELDAQYRASPNAKWSCEKETKVFLAEMYLASASYEKAEKLFDEVASTGHYSDRFTAKATLQSVRLKRPFKDAASLERAVSSLKNLILQRKLENEPIYLEAALEYVDLMSQNNPQKRISLLRKIKAGFESEKDLLSKDYHASKAKFPEQAKIHQNYMRYFEAEILTQEKSLHPKAKEILLEIKSEAKEPLLSRIESLLKNI